MNWKSLPYYPWLFALYAVLLVYSRNVGEVFASEVWLALGVSLLVVAICFALALAMTRDAHAAGAISLILALAFFSFGHVVHLLFPIRSEGSGILIAAYGVIVSAGVGLVLWKKRGSLLRRGARAANAITLLLVMMALIPVVSYHTRGLSQRLQPTEAEAADGERARLPDSRQRPDIYYIVLDAYSGNQVLLHDFGYDNSAFTDALEARGFYVAYDSKAAYAITVPSLFSTLNMRYIDEGDRTAAQSYESDIVYMRTFIADNLVARELQQRGYTYVFMMSGYSVPSTIADLNVDFHPTGPVYSTPDQAATYDGTRVYRQNFLPIFLSTTALRGFSEQVAKVRLAVLDEPYDFREPRRALAVWDEAENIPSMPQATFTIIHVIKPHEPVAFDHEGNIVEPYATTKNSTREELSRRFFEQLEFVNARTLEVIDTILEQSDTPPVIILQGDHGSVFGNPRSAEGKRTNFGILNAYHFPGGACDGLTPEIIPVNSFRVMFNCVFGEEYDLLPAHYYDAVIGYENLFRLQEVDIDAWEAEHEGE